MSTLTQKQLHLVFKQGPFELVSNQPVPKPGPGDALVKILASALNPFDWQVQAYGAYIEDYPVVLGTDIVGEVVELGEGVEKLQVGDRIFFQGAPTKENFRAGFSQYALVEAEYAAPVPSNVSVEEASTLPVALGCAVVGLYGARPLGVELTPPFAGNGTGKYENKPLIVLGGSASVGQSVLQLAKLSGFSPIITTASIRHTTLLKNLGATHVLDRALSDTEMASQVSSITPEPITLVYDCVSSQSTQYTGYSLLSSNESAQLIVVLPSLIKAEDQVPNKEIIMPFGAFTMPSTRELGKQLYKELGGLVERGEIKPNRVELLSGGLRGIVGGLEKLKKGQVSAGKLVVRPQETEELGILERMGCIVM